jgi:penicillin-insensitive murein DD-endopeptidase
MLSAGCAELGVVGDGTTVSHGTANAGKLLDGVRLPDKGDGYAVYALWRQRGLRYGTNELIALVIEVAAQLRTPSGPPLAVGDLSFAGGGGAIPHHKSHQSGRDVDLLLYMVDAKGRSFASTTMGIVGDDGQLADATGPRLDVARTWSLVKALMNARAAEVQHIFLYEPLIQLVLDFARQHAEPLSVVERARELMSQPAVNAPHNDHMHVRIYCSEVDALQGCVDFGSDHHAKMKPAELPAKS